jgi:hypothetical protein
VPALERVFAPGFDDFRSGRERTRSVCAHAHPGRALKLSRPGPPFDLAGQAAPMIHAMHDAGCGRGDNARNAMTDERVQEPLVGDSEGSGGARLGEEVV